jgi:hypothetical protein
MTAHRMSQAIAQTQNGRPLAEASGTPVVTDPSPSHHGDAWQSTLTLVRVQADAASRRGRGLVRFLTDLTQRAEAPIPVVAQCEHCGRFFNVTVDLSDADAPIVRSLPDNCRCGTSLDTPTMIRDLIGTARHFVETASGGRAS